MYFEAIALRIKYEGKFGNWVCLFHCLSLGDQKLLAMDFFSPSYMYSKGHAKYTDGSGKF
jgi:hypothetical protein